MELYKAVCAATFGHQSNRPLQAALVRLSLVWLGAAALSVSIATNLATLPLHPSGNVAPLICANIFCFEAALVLPLLTTTGTRHDRNDHLSRLLMVLPLQSVSRWAALLLPAFVLVCMTLTLISYPLLTITTHLGMPLFWAPLCIAAGALASFGLTYGLPRRLGWLRILVIPAILWAQYKLFSLISNDVTSVSTQTAVLAFALILVVLFLLFLHASRQYAHDVTAVRRNRHIYTTLLPTSTWFLKKVLRNAHIRIGFIATVVACLITLWATARQPLLDAQLLGTISALLAATLCADIRALCKRYQPAEIFALKGSPYFAYRHFAAAGICAFAATIPLLWTGVHFGTQAGIQSMLHLGTGISIGIFVGTLVAAPHRDVLAQCIASLLCVACLLLSIHLPDIVAPGTSYRYAYDAGLICLFLLSAFLVEYKRNSYHWRAYEPRA